MYPWTPIDHIGQTDLPDRLLQPVLPLREAKAGKAVNRLPGIALPREASRPRQDRHPSHLRHLHLKADD